MTAQTLILPVGDERRRERATEVIKKLPLNRAWDVIVKPFVQKRTNTQNARLWVLHQKVAQQLGVSPDDMHEAALCRFFGYEEKKIGGIIRQIPLERSSPQQKDRFAKFMEATESWYIHEFGIFLE